MAEKVILVDINDKEVGSEEKIRAHRTGRLHRAFSVFVFNSKGQLLLQRRATAKYHSGGLWTNTCCSHPRPGEGTEEAAHRRLNEEMGFDCSLSEIFRFVYKVKFDDSLFEHEYDHVFVGSYDGKPVLNREEADDWKWIGVEELKNDVEKNPGSYTYWLKVALGEVLSFSEQHKI
jgi:isopentenyl-diphosphate delta-isomerase